VAALEAAHARARAVSVAGTGCAEQHRLEGGVRPAGLGAAVAQAQDNTWYPYSFLSPIVQNEPGITSGLQAVADVVAQVEASGIPTDKIILGGFSQGACLASEFVARHPKRYGGLLVFSGGVIGPLGMARHYNGSLDGTPVFMGCSDVDFHIPVERVEETADLLTQLGGKVSKKIYPGMDHTIIQDEIDEAMKIVRKVTGD
jgi:predicted esterase